MLMFRLPTKSKRLLPGYVLMQLAGHASIGFTVERDSDVRRTEKERMHYGGSRRIA